MEIAASLILFFIVFVWILIVLIGLGFMTEKIFNLITVSESCPNVDMDPKKIMNLNGVQYVKLNYPTTIVQGTYQTIDTSNSDQMNIIKISLISLWIILGLVILLGVPLLLNLKS